MSQNQNSEIQESSTSINSYEPPSRPFKLTMEIPLFLLMFGLTLSGAVISNILLYRTCVHTLYYDQSKCALLLAPGKKSNETQELEDEVQKYAAIIGMVRSMIEAIVPAFLSLFLGVWSDIYGRKPLVVWPLFGVCLSSFLLVFYSVMNHLGPWWFLVVAVPVSLSGGYSSLFTGAFCYVSDITSNDDRSFRLSLLEAAIFAGTIFGSLTSPFLLDLIGNVNLLLVTSAINVAAYAYANIWVVESVTGALKGGLLSVLDWLLVKEMVETCFKRRPNKGREIIFLLLMCNGLSILIMYGVMNLDYLYTRQKLEWSLENYSVFSSVNTVIMIVGLLLGVTFVQKVLHVSDILLAAISYVSSIADYLVKAFAVTTWHMYFGSSISLFRGLAAPLIRSILSKILPIEDIAKIFALMSVLDAIFPIFAPLLYSSLYSVTIVVFPGGIYILSASIYFVCLVMLCTAKYYMWKYSSTPYTSLAR